MKPLAQHQVEIARNKESRATKPLIRRIYASFYDQIIAQFSRTSKGALLEIGAGSGELKRRLPEAICSDIFANPWLDLVCDGYALPFQDEAIANLILFDVFHHLARPRAFIVEAGRVLAPGGRLILFEPYISATSLVAYGAFHHEPVDWRGRIDLDSQPPSDPAYYAAQGNATRLFFGDSDWLPAEMKVVHRKAHAGFAYLLSGGLSKPALYPQILYPSLSCLDRALSSFPKLFGARCLVTLERS